MEEMQRDCRAAPPHPASAALGHPCPSEQSLPCRSLVRAGAFVVAIRAFHARGRDVVLADVQRRACIDWPQSVS